MPSFFLFLVTIISHQVVGELIYEYPFSMHADWIQYAGVQHAGWWAD